MREGPVVFEGERWMRERIRDYFIKNVLKIQKYELNVFILKIFNKYYTVILKLSLYTDSSVNAGSFYRYIDHGYIAKRLI